MTRAKRGEAQAFIAQALASNTDECIIWPYALSTHGYAYAGQCNGDAPGLVSRRVCASKHGPCPPKHEAAHSCRTPACINPNHLSWKTPKENTADRKLHGTENIGERNGRSKLTLADVAKIREAKGKKYLAVLAKEFGISRAQVSLILSGKSWK